MQIRQKLQIKKGGSTSIGEVEPPVFVSSSYHGFSFIESMFAVAVLSFGIIAVLPLLTSGMRETFDSRDQLIASMLAQEGAELVQNIRDNNWASDEDFDNNFPGTRSDCTVSHESDEIKNGQDCNGNASHYILKLDGGDYYNHSSGDETKFRRKIKLAFNGFSPDQTLGATSMVIWGGDEFPLEADCNAANKCVYSTLTLTEWH